MAGIDLKPQRGGKGRVNRRRDESRRSLPDLRWVLHLAMILLLAGGVAAGWQPVLRMVTGSDYFAVDRIDVGANHRLSREEILQTAGIAEGMGIFGIDPVAVGHRLEAHPWIKRGMVNRRLPRQIDILVQERVPVAIVNLGLLYYVDAQGEVFKVLTSGDPLDFPVISGIDPKGVSDVEAKQRIGRALEALVEIEGRTIFNSGELSELAVDQHGNVTLYTLRGGVPVLLGSEGFGEKLDRLERLYPELLGGMGALTAIDLDVNDKVIVRTDQVRLSG